MNYLVGGIPTPLKNMKVSWGYYSQYMEIHEIHVPKHQPAVYTVYIDVPSGNLT